jgi:hypothetical protein
VTFGASTKVKVIESEEYRILQLKFSSGVTFHELRSIADVLSACARVPRPSREASRCFSVLLAWFRCYWSRIIVWLPAIELRDEENLPINARRELLEKAVSDIC